MPAPDRVRANHCPGGRPAHPGPDRQNAKERAEARSSLIDPRVYQNVKATPTEAVVRFAVPPVRSAPTIRVAPPPRP